MQTWVNDPGYRFCVRVGRPLHSGFRLRGRRLDRESGDAGQIKIASPPAAGTRFPRFFLAPLGMNSGQAQ